MANQWHILVVEDEQNLNRNRVELLRKDGYAVQGVANGAEAIRLLWTENYDVVICDQKMPDVDGLEFLQWMRAFRPDTRMIMIASADSSITRTQALEGGVVSYLLKPVDIHVLKEELRRLLQQTGFSASLDSFDLLDLIQIISMSHKTIALVVNTGLQEMGTLRFRNGELVWAEYGTLRGEEAFFALAAYKNGTVIHQPWNGHIASNVTQPLSRLIFQALQYRTKYAASQQLSGEQEAVRPAVARQEVIDDSPFMVLSEEPVPGVIEPATPITPLLLPEIERAAESVAVAPPQPVAGEGKEWWQESSEHRRMIRSHRAYREEEAATASPSSSNGYKSNSDPPAASVPPSTARRTNAGQRTDLPGWLLEQPTQFDLPAMRLKPSAATGHIPVTPVQKPAKPSPAEWQPPQANPKEGEPPTPTQMTGPQPVPKTGSGPQPRIGQNIYKTANQAASPEWQLPEDNNATGLRPGARLKSLTRKTDDLHAGALYQQHAPVVGIGEAHSLNGDHVVDGATPDRKVEVAALWGANGSSNGTLHSTRRNFAALVAALQTLGYTVPGFVASAVVSLDGQPIAQVAVDDLDISLMCDSFSTIVRGALLSLDQGKWGQFEQTVVSSATYHVLLRIIGGEKEAFQVLITTHETNPAESLAIMANVEAAIASALGYGSGTTFPAR
ncbi:MAG TPA: response regulator [Ktedonobacteraceae bacterium]|jgi:DNA-binding response OmpR family regulator/predicted regulator of Ras-like GTPase activity (Roadblock/LC7/MglB family)|nr:response regulator [Ktedonobacteraceae bacterium]